MWFCLVSQAFTGAHNPQTLGIILQRSIIIMALFSIPFGLSWYYGEYILIWMGQDPQLASMAQVYLYYAIPALFPTFISTAIRKFVQSLGKMKITMYMVIIIFPLNHLTDYLLLSRWDLGMQGPSLQNTLFHFIVMIVYGLFLYFGTDFKNKYWPGLTREAFYHWNEFLKLGIPGMLSVSTDWAFEVCALLTGVLGETNLAAQSVVLSVNSFLIMIPTAISNSLTVRLGHHLGANQPGKAKSCAMISFFVGFCIVTLNSFILYAFRYQIASYFTKNEQIIDSVVELFIIVSPCHYVVGLGVVLSGILNAFGKQYVVAIFNLTSYYMIGLPFGMWLTFSHQSGLIGVWSGVAMAGLIKCVGEAFVLIYYIDWENECYLAMKRVADQEVSRTII
ncbi:mate-domain-containing protein [Cunninghamella echinulata]|nr:mate-domain-containing protein [Cunninghamella echinulata]